MSHAAKYPTNSAIGANPSTRTLAESPIERIMGSIGNSECGSPTRIILAFGANRTSRRKARSDSAIRLYGLRNPKIPNSGVHSSSPSLCRYWLRSASGTHAPWGITATGPVKPAARISSSMKRLCTITPRALSSSLRVIGTPS